MLEGTAVSQMKTIPYAHQLKEYEEHYLDPSRALLWQPRTGKSKTMIDTACRLFEACEIQGVLIVAPNGIHINWVELEIPTHAWDTIVHATRTWRFSQPDNAYAFERFILAAKLRPE